MPLLTSKRASAGLSRSPWWQPSKGSLAILCVILFVFAPLLLFSATWDEGDDSARRSLQSWDKGTTRGKGIQLPRPRTKADTLVLYIFSNTDAEYEGNLRFFLKHGVRADDGCDYVVVIQTGGTSKPLAALPDAPPNVRFEYHPNECYDWGTMGWLLGNRLVDPSPYTYFIFMNASVRGPFVPPYLWGKVRWQDVLTSRLSGTVKLVGPTISCEGSPKDGDVGGEWRTNPHVQSYVVATDKVGLGIMWDDGTVFECYKSMWDVIFYSELGSSWTVLAAGYSIDTLMLRYQGVDWTELGNWDCNARVNPYGENYYDGITIDPFEVMFVKVKELLLERGWSYAVHAAKYDAWLNTQASKTPDITSNVWAADPRPLKANKIGYMRYFGSRCFDTDYYREHNWDQKGVQNATELWEHWVLSGQFEARPHRFTCKLIID